MKYLGLVQIALVTVVGVSVLWSTSVSAAPTPRYGVILNFGYSEFEPDSSALRAEQDDDIGYRLGVFYDPDGESDQGFEFDVSWVNYGEYEYCVRDIGDDIELQQLAMSEDTTTRIGQVCNEFEADGLQLGATYVVPLGRLSRERSILDKFSGFVSGGYSDLDFNPAKDATASLRENDEGFYWEAGLLWTGGFGGRAQNFGVRASYRAHDNNGIEYWSVGLVWDI